METAVRWSPSSIPGDEKFLSVDVIGKSFQLCRVKSRKGKVLNYETIAEHKKVPPFRAFDWAPSHEGIVVVGQESGEATVLRVDDGSQGVLSFPIRNQRLCNAIAVNSESLLATGLDKVRTDTCLHIWDLQQHLPSGKVSGFGTSSSGRIHPEPLHKLASSEPITSIKFFRRQPQTLVAGVKGQFVRLYDLREAPASASVQFSTRCVHNTAIDLMDENYFASCYPTQNPTICIWDRRAGSRPPVAQSTFFSTSSGESTPLRTSLELRNAAEARGSIWSLRFSNTRRGCLTMLSSTGHFKTYDIGKEWQNREPVLISEQGQQNNQDPITPEPLYLNGIQDLQHAFSHEKEGRPEAERIVSFDFMNLGGTWNEPKVITLTGSGRIAEYSFPMIPEPVAFSSIGTIHRGRIQKQRPSDLVNVHLPHGGEGLSAPQIESAESKKPGAVEAVMQYVRCMNGYLFSLPQNKEINSNRAHLRDFWSWIAWARREQVAGNSVQDNLDLAYLGLHAIWMDDLGPKPYTTRALGPSPINMGRITENLVKRLAISASRTCLTDYEYQRRLCLYSLRQAWTHDELKEKVDALVAQGQHTTAAAIAVFSAEPKLAYRALRSSPVQYHKVLAIAIVSAIKRSAGDDDDDDDHEWAETLKALATDLTDPFAHAILTYLENNDWTAVIEEETLPLNYRIGVAFRWLNDRSLIKYVSKTTKDVITAGDIEGIVLTGLGTPAGFELLSNYARRTGDLQTAVLALTWTVPRYVDDPLITRQFLAWRETYRNAINSWNLNFNRVDFDIISSRIAVSGAGKRLLQPAKQQVALTCGYCNQGLAQFPQPEFAHTNGLNDTTTNSNNVPNSSIPNGHKTARNPLTSEKAAAIGTICPKCGRPLPRCGVCDMDLGTPDASYLNWTARTSGGPPISLISAIEPGSVDLTASLTASVITTLGGPLPKSRVGSDSQKTNSGSSSDPAVALQQLALAVGSRKNVRGSGGSDLPVVLEPEGELGEVVGQLERKMKAQEQVQQQLVGKFIAFCVKCSHGFHADHALEWFRGVAGRVGHGTCPVSECSCACDV